METLTLEQAYFVAQIVAGIAVVLSLIYVGLGVRQNAQAVRLSTSHAVSEDLRDISVGWMTDIGLCDLMVRAVRDAESISGAELFRFYANMNNLIRALENGYFQFVSGALDPRLWKGMKRQYADVLSTPGARAYWDARKYWFSEEFQRYAEESMFAEARPKYKFPGT